MKNIMILQAPMNDGEVAVNEEGSLVLTVKNPQCVLYVHGEEVNYNLVNTPDYVVCGVKLGKKESTIIMSLGFFTAMMGTPEQKKACADWQPYAKACNDSKGAKPIPEKIQAAKLSAVKEACESIPARLTAKRGRKAGDVDFVPITIE